MNKSIYSIGRWIILLTVHFLFAKNMVAQNQVLIKSQADLQELFRTETIKAEDSIKKKVKSDGVIYVRFTLSKDGTI